MGHDMHDEFSRSNERQYFFFIQHVLIIMNEKALNIKREYFFFC